MDTIDIWKEQFNRIYSKAASRVQTYRETFKAKNNFSNLTEVEKRDMLIKEADDLQENIEKQSSLEYFENFNEKETLFDIYFSIFMEYEIDDEENLLEGVTLAGKRAYIFAELAQYEQKESNNPRYDFKDFLNGKITGSVDRLYYQEGAITKRFR
ncbi:hypothetical protein LWM68_08055 [Niabella sp. W65]|nr:hypothetical protein [Niabella sp. W65]MCH7362720.1 hypothetical protein [Niabella sp. W65]